jgi:hypothetical protein
MNVDLLQFYYGSTNHASDFYCDSGIPFGKTLVTDNDQLAKNEDGNGGTELRIR